MKKNISIILTLAALVSGCATGSNNYSSNNNPATIKGEWLKENSNTWQAGWIVSVGSMKLNPENPSKTISVDHGVVEMKVKYTANKGSDKAEFWGTDPVTINAELKPNGKYLLKTDASESNVRFFLVDANNGVAIAETDYKPILKIKIPVDRAFIYTPLIPIL